MAEQSKDALVRMWQDRWDTDFYIAANTGQEIRCHRAVLATASRVFHDMLSNGMGESLQSASIDESPEHISLLLEFIYTKSLPIGLDCLTLAHLLRPADRYQLPRLFEICLQKIPPLVDRSNIIEVISRMALLRATLWECEQLFCTLIRDLRSDVVRDLTSDHTLLKDFMSFLPTSSALAGKATETQSRSRSPSGAACSGSASILEHAQVTFPFIGNSPDAAQAQDLPSDECKADAAKENTSGSDGNMAHRGRTTAAKHASASRHASSSSAHSVANFLDGNWAGARNGPRRKTRRSAAKDKKNEECQPVLAWLRRKLVHA